MSKFKILTALLLTLWCVKAHAQFGANISFDGSTQSVVTPSGMMNGGTIFTIEFWVKTTENRTNSTYWQRPSLISSASSGGPSGDFGITTNNGYIGIWSGLNSGGDNDFLSTTTQINDNAWHHIAAVNNGTDIKLYADGMLQGSISSGLGLSTNAAPLAIGSSSLDFSFSGNLGTCNFFHAGLIDEVRFSSSVRYTANFTVPSAAFTSDANTVALYHFDGCVGGLVPDASSHANNASPKNLTGSCLFTLPAPPAIPANSATANVSKVEYYFDNDPGFGSGTNIPLTTSADVILSPVISTAALSDGAHRLYIRTKNTTGNWSLTNTSSFFIIPARPVIPAAPASSQIVKAEYFYDTDPGFGSGTNIPITSSFDVSGSFAVNTAALLQGVHRIYVRTKDAAGKWSITNESDFYVLPGGITIPANTAAVPIVKAEYYLDNDPGFGSGTDIPVASGNDITLSNAFVNLTGLSDGVHHLFVRTKDAAGRWSITSNQVFSIIAASFVMPPNPIAGNITKLEYFFDTDPGFGNGHLVSVTPSTDLSAYNIVADVSGLADGTHTLYVRSYDGWGLTNSRTFNKGVVVPVTWLSFNARAVADSVLLNWSTTNEVNTAYFDAERSTDAATFKKIGTVAADNSNASIHNYQLADHNPAAGINYYRIKQVDADGHFKYSSVVAIRFGKGGAPISIYPNPAKDVVNVLFSKPQPKGTNAVLVNASGQVMQSVSLGGLQSKQLNVSNLAAGIYHLVINADDSKVTEEIVVRH